VYIVSDCATWISLLGLPLLHCTNVGGSCALPA